LESEVDEEERKRLLYVGMTAARDWLTMFIDRNGSNTTSFRTWIKSALGVDTEEDAQPSAACKKNQHYVRRFVDGGSINSLVRRRWH